MTIVAHDPSALAPLSEAEVADLAQLEGVIEQGLQTFYLTGAALATVRDVRLYRAEHKTFEDYCRVRWNLPRNHAYRLIDAAGVVKNLSPIGDKLPANEAQARPLAQLPTEDQPRAWQESVATAPNGRITAAHVAATVERFKQPEPARLPAPTPLMPDAVIAPPTPFAIAVAERLEGDGQYRRGIVREQYFATSQRLLGVCQQARDLLRHVDPSEVAEALTDDELKSLPYINELLGWFQRLGEARAAAPAIRRVK